MSVAITEIVIVVPPNGEDRAVELQEWLAKLGRIQNWLDGKPGSVDLMHLEGR
jgi:hypothetical protein